MTNKNTFIKLSSQTNSKITLVKNIVSTSIHFWGLTNDKMSLSETEINVLAYFIVYGINNDSKELIVKAGICKNIANINTIMVKLKKLKLIYKDELNGKNYICKQLNFEITPTVAMLLKLENK